MFCPGSGTNQAQACVRLKGSALILPAAFADTNIAKDRSEYSIGYAATEEKLVAYLFRDAAL
jgi:hypothetical protein